MTRTRFSVLTTVCDPPVEVLAACLASVAEQTWADFEHVVVDDASTSQEVRSLLSEAARDDTRVHLVKRNTRGGIVAAANDALAAASGELIALLDHDDTLAPHALATMHEAYTPTCDLAYSDHDMIRPDGRRADPVFKPDFSPERLRQQNYITHLVVARRSLVEQLGGFRLGLDGSQDHDLLLRLGEQARSIVHVPEVLYHWRMTAGSVALDPDAKRYSYERGRQAVADHCARVGIDAEVELGRHLGTYRLHRAVTDRPKVSVVIVSAGESAVVWGRQRPHLAALLESLDRLSSRPNEVVVVSPTATIIEHDERVSRVEVAAPGESPFAVAAATATGDVVVLLDEAMTLIAPAGIDELTALLSDDSVAAVGSAQFHADGCVRHGGFATHGAPADILFGWGGDHGGPGRLMDVTREVSGVDLVASAWRTGEFAMFAEGLDASDTASAGLQLCQRARSLGSRVLWTPFSSWHRFDYGTRRDPALRPPRPQPLAGSATGDPFYNVNLAPDRADWLELPGRAGAPPFTIDNTGVVHWS